MSEEKERKEEEQTHSSEEEYEPNPRIVIAVLCLLALAAIAGSFLLRDGAEKTQLIEESKVEYESKATEQGVVRDGRYIGYLVQFQLPASARDIAGSSDQYSETVQWDNPGGPGELSALPLLSGESLAGIARASGIQPRFKEVGSRQALFDEAKIGQVWVSQMQVIVANYKVAVSNIARSRDEAQAATRKVISTLARGSG